MSATDVYNKIRWIMLSNFNTYETTNHFSADFYRDLGLDASDVNLLIFYVENKFQIKLQEGAETKIKNMNQLVSMVYREKHRQHVKAA